MMDKKRIVILKLVLWVIMLFVIWTSGLASVNAASDRYTLEMIKKVRYKENGDTFIKTAEASYKAIFEISNSTLKINYKKDKDLVSDIPKGAQIISSTINYSGDLMPFSFEQELHNVESINYSGSSKFELNNNSFGNAYLSVLKKLDSGKLKEVNLDMLIPVFDNLGTDTDISGLIKDRRVIISKNVVKAFDCFGQSENLNLSSADVVANNTNDRVCCKMLSSSLSDNMILVYKSQYSEMYNIRKIYSSFDPVILESNTENFITYERYRLQLLDNNELTGREIMVQNAQGCNVSLKLERPYYEFKGWDKNSFPAYMKIKDIDKLISTHGLDMPLIKINALWEKKTYAIKYVLPELKTSINNPNAFSSWTVTDGTKELMDASAKDYIFKGWYNDPYYLDKANEIGESNISDEDEDHILYARFVPKKYISRIVANDMKLKLKLMELEYSIEKEIDLTEGIEITGDTQGTNAELLKRGYRFLGFMADGELITKVGGMDVKDVGQITALFEPLTVNVTLDASGGKVQNQTTVAIFNSRIENLETPVRMGYIFEGWYAGGKRITRNTINQFLENITFVAKWTPRNAMLKLNSNGGELTDTKMEVTYGEKLNLPTPVRSGYSFEGWYINGVKIGDGDISTFEKDASLTAKWKRGENTGDSDTSSITEIGETGEVKSVKLTNEDDKKKQAQEKVKLNVSSKGSIKVSWSKMEGYKKYQIQISRSKKFKKKYTETYKTQKTNYEFKEMKEDQKYYIRIRGVKNKKGKTEYGNWSKVKMITLK